MADPLGREGVEERRSLDAVLHTQRLRVDAAVGDAAGVAGEVAVLEWIRDRIPNAFEAAELTAIDQGFAALRGATSADNLAAAADQATRLASDVRNLTAD